MTSIITYLGPTLPTRYVRRPRSPGGAWPRGAKPVSSPPRFHLVNRERE
jgi:hypothetical protein